MSQRGAIQSMRVNGLTISYLSGKNADAHTPVFDMSVGEITIENTEKRPINLQYNSTNTFFNWHTFEFGTLVKNTYIPPRSHPIMSEPWDLINFNLLPGKKIQISRWDFMSLFQELGRAQFCRIHRRVRLNRCLPALPVIFASLLTSTTGRPRFPTGSWSTPTPSSSG